MRRDRYTVVRRWFGLRWDIIDETTGRRVVRTRNADVALSYVGILLAADLQRQAATDRFDEAMDAVTEVFDAPSETVMRWAGQL